MKKQRSTSTPSGEINLRYECYFDHLQHADEDLETCFFYEYARESLDLCQIIHGEKPAESVGFFKRHVAGVLQHSAFPAPWQSLSGADKATVADALPQTINALNHAEAVNIVDDIDFEKIGNEIGWCTNVVNPLAAMVTRSGAFAVNLAASPAAIGRAFERWAVRQKRLSKQATDSMPMKGLSIPSEYELMQMYPFDNPGPRGWFVRLRQLGALRWRYFCIEKGKTFKEGAADPDLAAARTQAYKNAPDFNAAWQAAVAIFAEIFSPEWPQHYVRAEHLLGAHSWDGRGIAYRRSHFD